MAQGASLKLQYYILSKYVSQPSEHSILSYTSFYFTFSICLHITMKSTYI